MKTEITDKQAIGKTVKEFVYPFYSGQFIIIFEDETFTTFGAKVDYDGEVSISRDRLNWLEFSRNELIEAEILYLKLSLVNPQKSQFLPFLSSQRKKNFIKI